MKKNLLMTAAVAMLAFGAAASETVWKATQASPYVNSITTKDASDTEDESLTFGYCRGYSQGLGVGQAMVTLGGAICLPKAIVSDWIGSEITSVRIGYGNCSNRNITIFLSNTINGTPFHTQTATVTSNAWNEIELTKPYVIEDKNVFIGYSVTTRTANDYPIGVDDVPTNNSNADYIGLSGQWEHIGPDYGSISIQVVIKGDNLPKNSAQISGVSLPISVKPGETFAATVDVSNYGTRSISDVTLTATVGETSFDNLTVKFSPAEIPSGSTGTATVSGLVSSVEGAAVPVTLTIDKVNGNENESVSGGTYSAGLLCVENGYQRKVVVEEWTGTWCGWCVRGIVGMGYMAENYGDENFIGIAVHGGDEMEVASYGPFLNKYAAGYPGCIINRSIITDPNTSDLVNYYRTQSVVPAIAEVAVNATYSEDNPLQINVDATSTFAVDIADANYSLAFVVTEDGVGPYYQTNYYAGGSYGKMDGWESQGSRVRTFFNEVARNIFDVNGLKNSVPGTIAAQTAYSYSTSVSTANIVDIDKCDVVALLLNNTTGVIENAAKVKINQEDGAGVTDVNTTDSVKVYAVDGAAVIEGDYDLCTVYSVDGSTVRTVSGETTVDLAAGIYIVKVNAANAIVTKKICVK